MLSWGLALALALAVVLLAIVLMEFFAAAVLGRSPSRLLF